MIQAYNWSGFYAGIHGGYGWGEGSGNVLGATGFGDIDGWFGGGQIGINWQAPGSPWVWGIEADLSGSDIGTSAAGFGVTADSTLDMFGTVRGRLGYAAWDRAMIYATGGFAWGRNELSISALGLTATEDRTHTGWVVGGGVEWALLDNWTAKVEYQYLMLDSETYFPAAGGVNLDADIHTIRVGLNYRFGGYGKAPVMAKY